MSKYVKIVSGTYEQEFSFEELTDTVTQQITIASIRSICGPMFNFSLDARECPALRTNLSKSVKFAPIEEYESPQDGDTITFSPKAGSKGSISLKELRKRLRKKHRIA